MKYQGETEVPGWQTVRLSSARFLILEGTMGRMVKRMVGIRILLATPRSDRPQNQD